MNAPLRLPLRHSRLIRGALWLLHLTPIFVSLVPQVPRWVFVCVVFVSLSAAAWHWHRSRRYRGASLCLGSDALVCFEQQGREEFVTLVPDCADLGWLIVLHWRPEGGGQPMSWAWTRDALPREAWRQLRVFLRWQAGLAR